MSHCVFVLPIFRGVKEVLKKRLKGYYKKTKFQKAGFKPVGGAYYDYYLVIDFEATCDDSNSHEWQHEIIEFPIVLIDGKTQEVVSIVNFCSRTIFISNVIFSI